jgi:hypothetical protein
MKKLGYAQIPDIWSQVVDSFDTVLASGGLALPRRRKQEDISSPI